MEQLDCRKGSVTFIVSLPVFPALPASPTHQEYDRWSSKGPSCFRSLMLPEALPSSSLSISFGNIM